MPDLNLNGSRASNNTLNLNTTTTGTAFSASSIPSPTSPVPSISLPSNDMESNQNRNRGHRLHESSTSSSNAGDLGNGGRIRGPLTLSPNSSEIDLNLNHQSTSTGGNLLPNFGTGSLDMPGILLSNADEDGGKERTVELSRPSRLVEQIPGPSNSSSIARNNQEYPFSHSHTESYGMGGLPSQPEDSPSPIDESPRIGGMGFTSLNNPSTNTLGDVDQIYDDRAILTSNQNQQGYDRFGFSSSANQYQSREGSRSNTLDSYRNGGHGFGGEKNDGHLASSTVGWTESPSEMVESKSRPRNLDTAGRDLEDFQDVDVEDLADTQDSSRSRAEENRKMGLTHRSSADFYHLTAGGNGNGSVAFTDQGMDRAKSGLNRVGKSIKRSTLR